MKTKLPTYIGIDVGGTKILAQNFDEKLKVLRTLKEPTDTAHGTQGFTNQLSRLIDTLKSPLTRGIGIAVPGIVDYRKGILVKAPHLPIGKPLPLRPLLEKRFRIPVSVNHDINAFLAAEYQKNSLKKHRNLLAVMVGTGLGGAAIADGKIYRGESGFAGEFGHIVIEEKGDLKTLEQRTSGHHLPRIAKMLKLARPERWNGPYLAERIKAKDPQAKTLVDFLVTNLGIGLANLNLIFNPEAIVLGGSIYRHFLKSRKVDLRKVISRHALDGSAPALIDAKDETSVAKGAALLTKDRLILES